MAYRDNPGRTGRLPSQSPHRPVRARLTHTVPRDMVSLRVLTRTHFLRYLLLLRSRIQDFSASAAFPNNSPIYPVTALSSSGSPWVGFAVLISTMPVLRLPPAIPPHFVASVWRYHLPLPLFVPPDPLPRGRIRSGLDVPGLSPVVTLTRLSMVEQYGPPRFLGSPLVPLP